MPTEINFFAQGMFFIDFWPKPDSSAVTNRQPWTVMQVLSAVFIILSIISITFV